MRGDPDSALGLHHEGASDEPSNEDSEKQDVSQHLVSSVVVVMPVVGMAIHQSSVFSGTNW